MVRRPQHGGPYSRTKLSQQHGEDWDNHGEVWVRASRDSLETVYFFVFGLLFSPDKKGVLWDHRVCRVRKTMVEPS